MDRTGTRIAGAILFAALAIRVGFVLATPHYALIHDALDYQRHAVSIADGHGFALSYGRPTAFRPPAYPIFLAAVYARRPARTSSGARIANAFVGTGIVALIGLIAFQLWGRRVALVALALGAVYIPLILVGQSIMSEPLFVLCLLGAIACVLHSKRWPWVVAAGVLMGLAILGRANAIILLLPLGRRGLARVEDAARAVRGGGADGPAVDDPQLRDLPRLRAGLDAVRERAGGDVQQRGQGGQAEPGLVADLEARRRLPADLQPDP